MTTIGEISLWVSLLMAAWATVVSFVGATRSRPDLAESGERAIHATFALLLLAVAGLGEAIVSHDFSIAHVASTSSVNLPRIYLLGSLWAERSGAWLIATCALAGYAVTGNASGRRRHRPLVSWMTRIFAAVLLSCLLFLCFRANPYRRLDWVPLEGLGMRPELQNFWTTLERPVLLLGITAMVVPVAILMAERSARQQGGPWITDAARWSALSWLVSTIGVLLMLRGAYANAGGDERWLLQVASSKSLLAWVLITAFAIWLAVRLRDTVGTGHARPWHFGAYAAGAGMVMMLAAVAGQGFRTGTDAVLRSVEAVKVTDRIGSEWTFRSLGVSRYSQLNRHVVAMALDVSRDERRMGIITSERLQHFDGRGAPTYGPSRRDGTMGGWTEDVRVALRGVAEDETAIVRLSFIPLMRWLWIGGILAAIGGFFVLWPAELRPPE